MSFLELLFSGLDLETKTQTPLQSPSVILKKMIIPVRYVRGHRVWERRYLQAAADQQHVGLCRGDSFPAVSTFRSLILSSDFFTFPPEHALSSLSDSHSQ